MRKRLKKEKIKLFSKLHFVAAEEKPKLFNSLRSVAIKERLEQQNGVTLVALGTTIVILMIIARNYDFYANIRPWNN